MIEQHDKDVEFNLLLGLHEMRCAWHFKIFGFEKVMREASPGHETDAVSHGICSDCAKIFLERQKSAAA